MKLGKLRIAWSILVVMLFAILPASARNGHLLPFTDRQYWLLGIPAFAIAAAPWFQWSNRFSLRTLLFATTLVALALGLVVWAVSR